MNAGIHEWEGLVELLDALESVGYTTQADIALAVAFWFDRLGRSEITRTQFEDAFLRGRRPVPSRVKRVLDRLCAEGLVVENSKTATWLISSRGRKMVRTMMEQAGFPLSEAPRTWDDHLKVMVASIQDEHVRDYVDEAVRCLLPPVSAYRAAILMGWTALACYLRKKVQGVGLDKFNAAYAYLHPSSKRRASHPNDLQDFRDRELVETCEALRIYDKATKERLLHWLALRNAAAHPTEVRPGIKVVEAFFEEIIGQLLGPQ